MTMPDVTRTVVPDKDGRSGVDRTLADVLDY